MSAIASAWNESEGGVRRKYGYVVPLDRSADVDEYEICGIRASPKTWAAAALGPDDAAPVVVQPPASSVDHVEFGYSVAYASGKFVVGARELGDDKIGAAFLYTL